MEQSYSSFQSPRRKHDADIFSTPRVRSKSDFDQLGMNLSFEDYKNRKSAEKPREKPQKQQTTNPEKYALTILRMTPTQFARYKYAFGLLDLSDTGKISKPEFEKVLGFFGLANDLSQGTVKECFVNLDRDGDKNFTLNDFLREINNQKMFKLLTQFIKGLMSKENEINNYRKEQGKPAKNEVQIPYEEEDEDEEDEEEYEMNSEVFQANPQRYAKAILKIDDEEYEKYQKAFNLIDRNSFGSVTKEKFLEVMDSHHFEKEIPKGELNFLFNKMDSNFDGEITFLDLLRCVKKDKSNRFNNLVDSLLKTLEITKTQESYPGTKEGLDNAEIREAFLYAKFEWKMDENYLRKLFKVFKTLDINKQNSISKEDFDEILQKYKLSKDLSLRDFENIFKELDLDNDGKINFMEFILAIHTNTFNPKTREILNAIFEQEDKSLIIAEKQKTKEEVISPEEPLQERELNIEKEMEKEKESRAQEGRQDEQEIKIEKEAEEEPKRSHEASRLDQELHRKLRHVDQDVTDLNRHMQQNLMIMEERYRTDLEVLKRTLSQKDEIIIDRNSIIDGLQSEIKNLTRKNEELTAKAKELEEKIANSNETSQSIGKEKEQARLRENQLQEMIDALKKENEELVHESKRKDRELKAIKEENQKGESNKGEYQNKINQLTKQVESLNQVISQIEAERDQDKEKVQNLERERAQLYSDLSEVKKDIEVVYCDEDQRKKQIEELCKKLERRIDPEVHNAVVKEKELFAKEVAQLKEEINLIQNNNNQTGEERKKLQAKIQELEKDRARLYETCNKVNEDLHLLGEDIEGFEEREKNHIQEIDELKRQLDNICTKEEGQRLRSENERLSAQIKQIEEEIGDQLKLQDRELLQEISEVEGSLKRLQRREGEYGKQIGALSHELGAFTLDTEKLKLDNSLLQDRVSTLQDDLAQQRAQVLNAQEINRRILSENNSLKNEILKTREEKQKYQHELQDLYDKEHRLKEDLEKLRLEFQSLKIRNLVLEDRAGMLEKEKLRLEDLYKKSSLKHLHDITPRDIENLNKQIRELRKENIQLRQQIDELRIQSQQQEKSKKMKAIRFSRVAKDSEKENRTPQIPEDQQQQTTFRTPQSKGMPRDSAYLEAIEKIKEELKHVKESREAILNSLEKERMNVKGVLQDTAQSLSATKTPRKDLFAALIGKTPQEGSQEEEETHEPTARKRGNSPLTIHSAPETIKKTGARTVEDFSSPKETGFSNEARIAEISRFAFEILYWLTDNALLTKELCSFVPLAHDDQITNQIKKIMQEVHVFADKAKAYYSDHVASKDLDAAKTVFDFVLPLFNECFQSHEQLKGIQNQVVGFLKKTIVEDQKREIAREPQVAVTTVDLL